MQTSPPLAGFHTTSVNTAFKTLAPAVQITGFALFPIPNLLLITSTGDLLHINASNDNIRVSYA